MLPSHLRSNRDDEPTASRIHGLGRSAAAPPLGLTGVLCDSHTMEIPKRGVLHYTIFRPRFMNANMPPPLVCIAGGPLLPPTYLGPLVHLITDRAVVFYQPLGVGQSSLELNCDPNDLDGMVSDFAALIERLPTKQWHLYGHSFGGIVAYEYLVRNLDSSTKSCLSVVLSNTPVSLALAIDRSTELMRSIRLELGSGADEKEVQDTFSHRHECRVVPLPLPLHQTYEMAGFRSSPKGLITMKDYVAHKVDVRLPPALILQGQHDFCECSAWSDFFSDSQVMVLAGCSHFGMLENENLYGSVLSSFLTDHDPDQGPLILPNGVRVRRS